MNPERVAALVTRWVRCYTRGLPAPIAERRIGEIAADLHDHITCERDAGTGGTRIALGLLSRMVRGLPADVSWRGQHLQDRFPTLEEAMKKQKTAYRSAVGVALAAALILLWGMGAVGVIGVEGDRADLMYFGVLAVGVVGAVLARFRPAGMARALVATAAAQALVTVLAFAAGKHESPATSVLELLGLNGFFAALFLGSAWLFRRAEPRKPPVLR
ncbi:hypothetical protein [Amycolatopsis albispora]|uniref:Uncharacterized protein n=1 Tax=Amycolatopsis albispora TaxID=1804986 RepID=A0A344L6M5_9PSEU|nr:hypothetical protein [Amycolatopsis albispora]AXB43699.1 hypothetical protein A4R43_15150 [Amycolatopsis albispora]